MANNEITLDSIVGDLEKKYRKGIIMDTKTILPIETISSGDIAIDKALGVGGYPKGRIVEIYGPESSGKTTIALHAIAEAQKLGLKTAFIDAEHALDLEYAENLGVKVEDLWVSQPDYGEQALGIVENLVQSNLLGMIVIDSVSALTPKAEIEGDMGDSHMGLQARLMGQALRKLTAIVSKTKCVVIFINQLRMKIGLMFGSPEVTTGGKALKFYATMRLEVRKIETIAKGKEDATGNKTRIKVVKNKVASPFRKAEVEINFGKGVDKLSSLIDLASEYEVINKAGSWYSYNEEKIGQGKVKVKEFLIENSEILKTIESKVREIAFPKIESKRKMVEESTNEETETE